MKLIPGSSLTPPTCVELLTAAASSDAHSDEEASETGDMREGVDDQEMEMVPHDFREKILNNPFKSVMVELLLNYVRPIFENESDCHRALMLWFGVGDLIPIDSEMSRTFEVELGNPNILFDVYGEHGMELASCCFDTRAEVAQTGILHSSGWKNFSCVSINTQKPWAFTLVCVFPRLQRISPFLLDYFWVR